VLGLFAAELERTLILMGQPKASELGRHNLLVNEPVGMPR
jgi:hypothetical protein